MGRFDNVCGDEDEIEYEQQQIKELKEQENEDNGIEEWKLSRDD